MMPTAAAPPPRASVSAPPSSPRRRLARRVEGLGSRRRLARRVERSGSRRRLAKALATLCAAGWGAWPGAGSAQHGMVAPPDRVLHERLAEATHVAFATLERVDEGRIAVADAETLRGALPAAFEIKRAPSAPPPWIVGERALLLLSGQRSPYRWVERPVEAEAIRLAGAGDERVWRAALAALDAVREQALARRDLYVRWCDDGPEALRAVALRALLDVPTMVGLVDAPFARARARVAADATRPLAARRAAARVAARHPAGVSALLAQVDAEAGRTDAQILEVALQAGLLARDASAEPALSATLREGAPAQRAVALRLAVLAMGHEAEQVLAELAVGHDEPAVRDQAMAALKKLRRNRERRGG